MNLSFPSKTFLVGEYAVIHGAIDAVLLSHPPFFRATLMPGKPEHPFHPASPAGKRAEEFPPSGKLTFTDPHRGCGGFGGSGAEFLSIWGQDRALPQTEEERRKFAWAAWDDTRRFPGSGADILVQAFGVNQADAYCVRLNIFRRELEKLPVRGSGTLSLFHTGRKLATHENLSPPPLPMDKLRALGRGAVEALWAGKFAELARQLQSYGDALAGLGLLTEHSALALNKAHSVPKVLAAKGCGAMGADVLLVAHEGADLASWAAENSLTPAGNFPV